MNAEVNCVECDVDIAGNSEHDHDLEVCCDCIEDKYDSCQHCDQLFPKSDLIEAYDEPTCEDCFGEYYTECGGCGDTINQDETYYSESTSDDYCEDCYYGTFTRCEGCDYEMQSDYANYSDSDGCSYCDDCYEHNGDVDLDSYGQVSIHRSKSFESNKFHRAVGIEIEACNKNYNELEKNIYSRNFEITKNWRIVSDGSIHPSGEDDIGKEFVTRGGMSGDELYLSINNMTSILQREGWYVNKSCGLHVHVDARDLNARELAYILMVAKLCEPVIYKMMPQSRDSSRWARRIPMSLEKINRIHDEDDFIDSWYRSHGTSPSMEKYNDARYCGFNMHSRIIHGSIEFRHHSGTLNPSKIINWIEICQSIINTGLELYRLIELKEVAFQGITLARAKKLMRIWRLILSEDDKMKLFNLKTMNSALELKTSLRAHINYRVGKFYDNNKQEDYRVIGYNPIRMLPIVERHISF